MFSYFLLWYLSGVGSIVAAIYIEHRMENNFKIDDITISFIGTSLAAAVAGPILFIILGWMQLKEYEDGINTLLRKAVRKILNKYGGNY